MNRLKSAAVLVAAVVCLAGLTACGTGKETTEQTAEVQFTAEPQETAQQTELPEPTAPPYVTLPDDASLEEASGILDNTLSTGNLLELYDILYPDISLSDVVLPENQKRLLLQILAERINNRKLIEHNLPSSNRLLFCGPPGCGKTVTAQAIAHELNLPMAYVRIDGLISSFLGQTSVNLRKVFSSVNDLNIVLFLDEFDSIAKKRDDGNEMGELKRVVTALLQNFDNMPSNVFLIAATNHEHLLDPAIWRRFNHIINIGYPNEAQRAELIYKWINEYSVKTDVDIQKITALTADCSAAQIKELVVSIAKRYVINNRAITMLDLIELLIQQMTNNSNGAGIVDAAAKLSTKGVSIRTLAKVIGIPHNTLNYQINKLLKGKEGD